MNRNRTVLHAAAAVALLVIAGLLAFLTVSQATLARRLEEARSLQTVAFGQRDKQQYEYDQTAADLPVAQAELARVQPLADAARADDDAMRAERKALRAEIAPLRARYDQAEALHGEAWNRLAEAMDAAPGAMAAAADALAEAEAFPGGGSDGGEP